MANFEVTRQTSETVAAAIAQYVFCKPATVNVAVAGAGDDAVGVTLEGKTTQQITDGDTTIAMALLDGGKVPITLGATVAAGAAVQSDAAGKAIVLAAGKKLGHVVEGGSADQVVTLRGSKGGGVA